MTTGRPATRALGEKGTLLRAITAACVVGVGVVALQAAVAALNWTINKPPMELRHKLTELTREMGDPVVYHGQPEQFMDEASLQTLGTLDYLLREYQDRRKTKGTLGASLMVNLNYYKIGSSSPHVPEVCWQGSGRVRHPTLGEREFPLKGVHHADGTVSDVKMRMLSFIPTTEEWKQRPAGLEDDAQFLRNVCYTFNVNGIYVANRREVESQFWRPTNKHAYHAKIEVTLPMNCAPDQAQPILEEFMRSLIPEVEKCMPIPDWAADAEARKAEPESSKTEPPVPAAP